MFLIKINAFKLRVLFIIVTKVVEKISENNKWMPASAIVKNEGAALERVSGSTWEISVLVD